jgi:hypothetical protein
MVMYFHNFIIVSPIATLKLTVGDDIFGKVLLQVCEDRKWTSYEDSTNMAVRWLAPVYFRDAPVSILRQEKDILM